MNVFKELDWSRRVWNVAIIQMRFWNRRKNPLGLLQILFIHCFLLISRGQSSKTAGVHTFIAEPNKHVSQLRVCRSFRERETLDCGSNHEHEAGTVPAWDRWQRNRTKQHVTRAEGTINPIQVSARMSNNEWLQWMARCGAVLLKRETDLWLLL